jgi:23S rRNA (uracil1939-C5)-methyltransferase
MVDVTIDRLANGGAGVARHEGQVLFVPGGLPGDRVRVEVVAARARHLEGRLVEVLEPSPARVEPPCPYALAPAAPGRVLPDPGPSTSASTGDTRCGGCQWLALDLAAQRAAHAALVRDALVRIGGFDLPGTLPVITADAAPGGRADLAGLAYRGRIEVALGPLAPERECAPRSGARPKADALAGRSMGGSQHGSRTKRAARAVGFRAAASHAVVDVARCAVAQAPLNEALATLRRRAMSGEIPPPVIEVELAVGDDPGRVVATARLDRSLPPRALARLADRLWEAWPGLAGLRVEGPRGAAGAVAEERGEPWIESTVPGPGGRSLPLILPAGVFAQANPAVNARLVEAVSAALAPAPGRRLLDLFAGAGNFTIPLAAAGAEVLGLEREGRAVDAARRSAARLGLTNARFRQVDVTEGLEWLAADARARSDALPTPSPSGGYPAGTRASPGSPGSPWSRRLHGVGKAGVRGLSPSLRPGTRERARSDREARSPRSGPPRVVDGAVLDPPRAGAGAAVVDRLALLAPAVVAYVSCEPTTLARDLARFAARGYVLEQVTVFEMFPQTAHVEVLARLARRS